MKNKVLIIGAYGNLGQELVKVFSDNFIVTAWDKDSLDITNEKDVQEKISKLKPDIIINAAAYNAVDKCEEDINEYELAKKINGEAVFYLAETAKKLNTIFVHYSTDYVFDGKLVDGYDENSIPNPISNYGKSKLLGEEKIKEVDNDNNLKYYLIRTSKLFGRPGISEGSKMSFFDTMVKVSENKKELKVVDAEVSCFTYTSDLAKETLKLIEDNKPKGIYHITNSISATWYEATKYLFELIKKDIAIIKVGSSEFPRPAKRPEYSILLNTKIEELRNWRDALKEYISLKS